MFEANCFPFEKPVGALIVLKNKNLWEFRFQLTYTPSLWFRFWARVLFGIRWVPYKEGAK